MSKNIPVVVKLLILRDDTLLFGIREENGFKKCGLPFFYPSSEQNIFDSLSVKTSSLLGMSINSFRYGPSFFHTENNSQMLVVSLIIWWDVSNPPLEDNYFTGWEWVRPSLWKTLAWNKQFVFENIEHKLFKEFDFSPHRWSGLLEREHQFSRSVAE